VRWQRQWFGRLRGDVELSNAREPRFGHSDPGLDTERPTDPLSEELVHAHAGDPTDDLTGQPSERQRVVLVDVARLQERLLFRQYLHHPIPVQDICWLQIFSNGREACAMGEQPPHRHRAFAVSSKLRPVRADRRVQVEPAFPH